MKIIHFTYSITGGAGIVVNKFHHLLKKNGFESAIVNSQDHAPEQGVYIVKALQSGSRKFINNIRYWSFRLFVRLRYKKSRRHNFNYNFNYKGLTAKEIIASMPFTPGIIFLHWVADFITPDLLQQLYAHYKCPIIWRYNDLAPATGGCHYTVGCENYKTGCGFCPALGSRVQGDWSWHFWHKKKEILPGIDLTVINSTHHTEEVYKASPLFMDKRQEFIRNSLPSAVYNISTGKTVYREELKIPSNQKVIFWGATHIHEPRKGFSYFLEALEELKKEDVTDLLIVIAGNKPETFNPVIPFEHRFTGLLKEQELAAWYRASDIVACSSLEDGGPMMIIESLLCGTPVVSFATGLALEVVITGETGYRAIKADAKDLATGLLNILNLQPSEYKRLSEQSYQKASALYSEETEINAYRKLFAELSLKKDS